METKLGFYHDPLRLEFEAEVVDAFTLADGRAGVALAETYFYPTGGGQEHDTGAIGAARVLDVVKNDARGGVAHVLDRPLPPGRYPAVIEPERRWGNMQHHSGQHLLSHAFLHELGWNSISANINWDTPSTVDLAAETLPPEELLCVETYANRIIFENRPVKSYFISDADLPRIPFRRPPKVTGVIRVVEIDGLDYTPCGGTHVLQTGMIGLVKIVRAERQNQKLRIHFVAGMQALRLFQQEHSIVQETGALLDTRGEELLPAVARLNERLRLALYEIESLKAEKLADEARRLAEAAQPVGEARLAAALFTGRAAHELRPLANELRKAAGMVGVLGCNSGQKLTLVVGCAEDSGHSASELLKRLLAEIGGRGGGDAALAQGGGTASAEQSAQVIAGAEALVRSLSEHG